MRTPKTPIKFHVLTLLFSALTSIGSLSAQEMVTAQDGELGRTISYNVSSFTDVRDKTMEDIMVKMPGITVNTDGGVSFSYNNIGVNKVYIDGVDMLEGQYEMVINMKPEDVERVEIIENHEPIKVMRGAQYSQDAAINIVLNDSARSNWGGTAKVGMGGSPYLYNGDVYAINVGGNLQTVALFKTDNTGLNLGSGSSALEGWGEYNISDMLDVEPAMAPLDDSRTRFNNSTLMSLTNTLKLSNDYQLNTNFSFLSDKLEAESSEDKIYYLNNGNSVTDLYSEMAQSTKRDLSANITLLANTNKFYLKNTLLMAIRWYNIEKDIMGTYPNRQEVEMKPFVIKDDFEFNKSYDKSILSLSFSHAMMQKPQELLIKKENEDIIQDIAARAIYYDARASYKVMLNKFTLTMMGGGAINMRDMDTQGTYIAEAGTLDNDSRFAYSKLYSNPAASYITDKLQVHLEFPINYYHYWFTDHMNSDLSSSKNRLYFAGTFNVNYEITPRTSIILSGRSRKGMVDKEKFYSGTILKNYRNISRGALSYLEDDPKSISASVSYKLSERSLFISGSISRDWNKSAYLNIMEFTPNYIISGYRENPHTEDENSLYLNGSINKGIKALRGKIGLDIEYYKTDAVMVRNDNVMPFTSRNIGLSPNINGRLSSWCNMIYNICFYRSSMKLRGSEEDTSNSNEYTQSLEMIFSPTKKFNFSLLGEHYYTEISKDLAKHLVLADFKAEYTLSDKWQLIGSVTNILNQKTYNYTLVDSSDFSKTFSSYRIRPRNVLLSIYYKF